LKRGQLIGLMYLLQIGQWRKNIWQSWVGEIFETIIIEVVEHLIVVVTKNVNLVTEIDLIVCYMIVLSGMLRIVAIVTHIDRITQRIFQ